MYLLWQEYLRFDPEDPIWPNRDKFILSAGHASTLLYSVLHPAGVKAAVASKWLAERYNRPNFRMFGYDMYALASAQIS